MLLWMQVMVLPPILYEAAVSIEKRGRVVTRLGTMLLSQLVLTFLLLPLFITVILLFGVKFQSSQVLLMAIIL